MNAKMKRRMVAVGGVIVIVLIVLLAFVASNNNAKVMNVAEAATYTGDGKVQVSGSVVENSYAVSNDGVLTFSIVDSDDTESDTTLFVSYDKGVSATFGNGVTAICTGRIQDGTLVCSELVTKCPSKYENASSALTVSQLLGYDKEEMTGKTVKVSGAVSELADATSDVRFVLVDSSDGGSTLPIQYNAALSDEVADGASVVVTGALNDSGDAFVATEVALEG